MMIVAAVAQHLLADGFRNSGLRALASSVGISDRMVMYYFKTKEELISAALALLAQQLAHQLDQMLPAPRASSEEIRTIMLQAAKEPQVGAFLMLWFEIVGLAMRTDGPYRQTAQRILDDWLTWLQDKLGPRRAHQAPALLAQLEGELLLHLLRD